MTTRMSAIRPTMTLVVVAFAGLAMGLMTLYLPEAPVVGSVVDSVAFWAMGAFVVGAFSAGPRTAVVAATAAEILGLAVWYAGKLSRIPQEFGPMSGLLVQAARSMVLWSVAGAVAGVVFGLAGWWWRSDSVRPRPELAVAVVVAVHLWSAFYAAVVLGRTEQVVAGIVLAGALFVVLVARTRAWIRTATMLVPLVAVGLPVGLIFVNLAYR